MGVELGLIDQKFLCDSMWDQKRTGESGETGGEDVKQVNGGESGRNISNNFMYLPLSPVSPLPFSAQLRGRPVKTMIDEFQLSRPSMRRDRQRNP